MEFKEIQDLLKLVNKTNLTEVEIEKKDFKITIRRREPESNVIYTTQQPSVSAVAPPMTYAAPTVEKAEDTTDAPSKEPAVSTDDGNLYTFKSPMIGTFYRASSPETPAFVNVGDDMSKGQVVCIVEAMKLFNEIESEVNGKIVKILVENAQPVEYDQPLFLVELSN